MILSIGEILFDIFPKYRRVGGAPFNFAWHLTKFGFPVCFASRVGDDEAGWKLMEMLQNSGFDTGSIQIDRLRPTGMVEVELDSSGVPRFTILPDVAYDYIAPDKSIERLMEAGPRLIYFGSLIQRTLHGFENLHQILSRGTSKTVCLYDMNLRPGCDRKAIIVRSLEQADILKCNQEELARVADLFALAKSPSEAVLGLMDRFEIKVVALTRGADGSELYKGKERFRSPASAPDRIADTVGAGDAYAAVLAAGILLDWSPERIISTATAFSGRICSIQGAIPESDRFYEDFFVRAESHP